MNLARRARTAVVVLIATSLLGAAGYGPAQAQDLRVPQIAFPSGSLQAYLDGVGENIDALNAQVDAQRWITSVSGNTTFTLMIELSGNAPFNGIGVYNANDPSPVPTQFQIFPAAATAGWFATAHFASGNLVVTLFDQNSIIQGQTFFAGVNATNFGFYIAGPGGTFYSQDFRNGGEAHALTYAGTGQNLGDWWECFEDEAWSAGNVDFDDAVLLLQSVTPTELRTASWGALKSRYQR